MKCDTCKNVQEHYQADLYACINCGLISSTKRGDVTIYDKNYITKYFKYAQTSTGILITKLRSNFIRKHIPIGKRVLDFGCGAGHFVSELSPDYVVTGYDVNQESFWFDPTVLKLDWDVVTFWDSLEHTNSPTKIVKQLNPEWLVIAVPCVDDYKGTDLTEWKHYRPHEHIHYYTEAALINFFEHLGYKVLEVNFDEAKLRKGFNGKNIITIIGQRGSHGKNQKTVGKRKSTL